MLATSDVPGGVVNILTGLRDELAPHLASHLDVDALDLDRADAELERAAADNVKRVVVRRARTRRARTRSRASSSSRRSGTRWGSSAAPPPGRGGSPGGRGAARAEPAHRGGEPAAAAETIRADLGLSGTAAGVLTALPVLGFGVLAPAVPRLVRRFAIERVLTACAVVTGAALALRGAGGVAALFAGTLLAGGGVAVAQAALPVYIRTGHPGADRAAHRARSRWPCRSGRRWPPRSPSRSRTRSARGSARSRRGRCWRSRRRSCGCRAGRRRG